MKQNKISRRDAIKLLGAVTGATVLANLPTKWSTPELTSGVIPAHAQTSCTGPLTITSVTGSQSPPFMLSNPPFVGCGAVFSLLVQLSAPNPANIPLVLQTTVQGSVAWYVYDTNTATSAPDGTYNSGFLIPIKVLFTGTVTFTVSFLNSTDGCGSGSMQVTPQNFFPPVTCF